MIAQLEDAAETLKRMRDDGVTLVDVGGIADDYVQLVTTDPDIAKKYDMHAEKEFWRWKTGSDGGEMQAEE